MVSKSDGASSDKSRSYLVGPTDAVLWNVSLSEFLQKQVERYGDRQCVVFPEGGKRWTYRQLLQESIDLAKGLVAAGVQKGDHVGIFAGNCAEYVQLTFATSHVGAALVILNNTYTPTELNLALRKADCKKLFAVSSVGKISNEPALKMLSDPSLKSSCPDLNQVIMIKPDKSGRFVTMEDFVKNGRNVSDATINSRIQEVLPDDVCNLQFTSGTTGNPKAAMLTHNNIVNNGLFVGDRMKLTPKDIVCCPPPLFHCFGLVLGLMACLTHGSSIVFPSESFNATMALEAVSAEKCTAIHGVPAMFAAELELLTPEIDVSHLRTGIAAGAPVPRKMMEDLRTIFHMTDITITYGMTETSPASFMTFTEDPVEKRLSTVGKILPHMRAKIINAKGDIVPVGTRGELCTAGFALQKAYWKNPQETAKVMLTDSEGIRWMHTGDEAIFDDEGYCRITGRIKDIIIRGGENIFPLEIEERLVQHPAIVQSSVIGVHDDKYGEVVCAYLQHRTKLPKPSLEELRKFVHETLGWHKAPVYAVWLDPEEDFPKTGSGKIQKHVLRSRFKETVGKSSAPRAKL